MSMTKSQIIAQSKYRRTKRNISLLVTPELYEAAKQRALINNETLSVYIKRLIAQDLGLIDTVLINRHSVVQVDGPCISRQSA